MSCFLNNYIHDNNLLAAIWQPDHSLHKNAFEIKLLKMDLTFYLFPFPPHTSKDCNKPVKLGDPLLFGESD